MQFCNRVLLRCSYRYLSAMCASLTISGICDCLIFSSIMSSFPFVHLQNKRFSRKHIKWYLDQWSMSLSYLNAMDASSTTCERSSLFKPSSVRSSCDLVHLSNQAQIRIKITLLLTTINIIPPCIICKINFTVFLVKGDTDWNQKFHLLQRN